MELPRFPQIRSVFLDFDRTLVTVDSWDVLADVSLAAKSESDRAELQAELIEIRTLIDEGSASFFEALQRRINLLGPTRADLEEASRRLLESIAPHAEETVAALTAKGLEVHVVAGSVRELVEPVAQKVGIDASRVHCNELDFDDDVAVQADMGNPLSQDGGKQWVLAEHSSKGTAAIVGDGLDDAEVKKMGGAEVFVAFTASRTIPDVVDKADVTVSDLALLTEMFGEG